MSTKLFIVVNVDWFFLSHRKEIALAAKNAGYDVTVVTADTGKLHDIEALGLKVINLPMNRSGMNIREELGTLRFLIRLYKREKPAIVHHVGMKTILWGTIAAKLTHVHGVANAISGLGGFFSKENKSIMSELLPRVLKWSHHRANLLCIFQNEDDWNMYVEHGIIKQEQGRFIKGSGVDLKQFAYTPEPTKGKIKVILTARMIEEKGIFLLTKAAKRLRKKYEKTAEFQLIGGIDDHPGAITEEQLKQECDGTYIKWLGYRTDVLDLLEQCHIVAFPSYYMEGLPKSLIEANAVGRPIITSNSVGCKETVIDGYNGFLITPKDIDALIEKLNILLSNADLRQQMGRNAREYAEKYFSIENVIEKHLAIYKELMN
jgi:glycosyltransferase involved in cell wall biosynthesis